MGFYTKGGTITNLAGVVYCHELDSFRKNVSV